MKTLFMALCAVALSIGMAGCGSGEQDPYAHYLKEVKTCTNYPDLELQVYRKAIKSVVDKCRSEGAGESLQNSAVSSVISQLPFSFQQIKGMPNERQTLEQMVNELEF